MLEHRKLIYREAPFLCELRLATCFLRLGFHMRAEVVLLLLREFAIARRHVRVQRSIA